MLPFIYHYTLTLIFLLFTITGNAQTFYANTGGGGFKPVKNETYLLGYNKCDTLGDTTKLTIYTCVANIGDTTYNDIAIDRHDNIWYTTEGSRLYKRKLSDTTSCEYVAKFPNTLVTALVADTSGNIYATGNYKDTCKLFKYDTSGIHYLGHLPKSMLAAGDLFFYEHRLFMTSYYKTFDTGFISEIVIPAPEQSCYYMSLGTMTSFGAFTIVENNKTRTFVTPAIQPDFETSQLVEIDIPNRKIVKTICNYPFLIRGAATYYERTGDSTMCTYVPKSITNTNNELLYLNIYSPVTNLLRIKTNLNHTDITHISLFDITGKKVKYLNEIDFPNSLNVSDIPDGLYLIQIISTSGLKWTQKIIKSSSW